MIDVARLTNGAYELAAWDERRVMIQHVSTGFGWWAEAWLLSDEQMVDDLFDSLDRRLLHAMVKRGQERLAAAS